ncbi:hypothetical protein V5P93_004657 [Actinokineospora auranticolor]|uniref:Uncharacterized protein n=1 Tax=Actinokineospora auranticolor TaxID=155976 RepID=A0A2S6GN70_9PSEU|nr:hypothetical protein [Actinokineospora auranticolor]PPK66616.1 hypothetical protein CLV40_1091 [Actinokineospora auranticolor]
MHTRVHRAAPAAALLLALVACSSPSTTANAPTIGAPTAAEDEQIGCLTTGGATTVPPTPQSFRATPGWKRAAEAPAADPGSPAVWAEIEHELATYQKSDYQHTTTLDRAAGNYVVDCSGWGNVLLRIAACDAYGDLVRAANATRSTSFATSCDLPTGAVEHGPYAVDWAQMLGKLQPGESNGHWTRVAKVADVVPGDVVTYALGPGASDTGHVMFAAGTPTQDATNPAEWQVPIADSTESRHGPADSRNNNPKNVDGHGIGTAAISLIVDQTGAPTNQFRWYPGAPKIDQVPAAVTLGHFTG